MHIKNFDPFDFKKKNIDGVDIYYKNIPWAPCIFANIIFNTGALKDEIGKEGTAHFLEHITLKGSPKIPDEKTYREWSKKYALNTSNAYTSFNNIGYVLKCLPENYEKVILDWKDMIFNCFIKEETIEKERSVILQEAWNRYQNDKFLKFLIETNKNIYHNHPYERFNSPLGYPETIKKINREDLLKYHKENFGIGNFYIILVGNIKNKHISFLKNFIKGLPILKTKKKTSNSKDKIYKIEKPLKNIIIKKAEEIGQDREQVEIDISNTRDKINLNKKMLDSLSRRLFYEICFDKFRVEHNLCYGVDIYGGNTKYTFTFGLNIKTDEKNIELIKREFKNIIKDFETDKFKDRFEDTKRLVIENFEASEYLSGGIIEQARNSLVTYNEVITGNKDLESIKKFSFKDIQKFIKEIFGDEDKIYTEIILPSKKENGKK